MIKPMGRRRRKYRRQNQRVRSGNGTVGAPFAIAAAVAALLIGRYFWKKHKNRPAQVIELHVPPVSTTAAPEPVAPAEPATPAPAPAPAPTTIIFQVNLNKESTKPRESDRDSDSFVSSLLSGYLREKPSGRRSGRALHTGIEIDNGRLHIADWSAWMTFAPAAMDRAFSVGAETPEDVLVHLLQAALPAYKWPPAYTSPLFAQWVRLAPILAEALGMQPPPTHRGSHLRVVK